MSTPETPPPAGGDEPGRGLSGVQRAGIVLGALAVLLIAFVVIRGSGDSGDNASSSTPQTTQSTATTTTDAGGGQSTTTTATTTTGETETETEDESESETGSKSTGSTSTSTTPAQPAARTIRVVNGQPQGGVKTVSYKKNDEVRLKVVSDVADEIHVHGYDLMKDVEAGGSVSFNFKATIEGRFEIELEDAGTQIANLEVTPG
jgi:hypothetical protein